MTDTSDERSGSRWEPDASEHPTEQLGQPTDVIPGMQSEEPPAPAPAPKRRIPRAAAAVAIVAAATIGGGLAGMALAGNQAQEVSDTATSTTENGAAQPGGDGTAPDGQGLTRDGDGDGFGHEHDGDGFGGHFGHGRGGH